MESKGKRFIHSDNRVVSFLSGYAKFNNTIREETHYFLTFVFGKTEGLIKQERK